MIEVVIDGTNFGGKTPLVLALLERIQSEGKNAVSASIYREEEVYSLWNDDPFEAATRIVSRMMIHRERAQETDVLVWDRGWPTCFVSTQNVAARRLFLPLQRLTFLLLNTDHATAKKVKKYGVSAEKYPWMFHHRLQDEISYEELSRRFADDLRVFRPTLEEDRFDLELVSGEIWQEILREIGLKEPTLEELYQTSVSLQVAANREVGGCW